MLADDPQLDHSESHEKFSDLVRSLQACVTDIRLWMEEHKLELNNKTAASRFSWSSSVSTTSHHPEKVSFSNTNIEFAGTVRNLDFIFDRDVSVEQHIIRTCKPKYIEVRQISTIRQYLNEEATKTL